jgi:transposase
MCRHYLDQLDHVSAVIDLLNQRIEQVIAGHDQDLGNLDTIPGIGLTAAQIVIAETGGNMAQFVTPGHLASWIAVCPGMNESAGVNKSGRTRLGNSNLKRLLGIAATSRDPRQDLLLACLLPADRGSSRLATRLGRGDAQTRIAIWHVLHDHVPYQELGADHFTKRDPERAMRRMTREPTASASPSASTPSRRPKQQRHVIFVSVSDPD